MIDAIQCMTAEIGGDRGGDVRWLWCTLLFLIAIFLFVRLVLAPWRCGNVTANVI